MPAKKNPRPVTPKAPVKAISRPAMRKSKGGGNTSLNFTKIEYEYHQLTN